MQSWAGYLEGLRGGGDIIPISHFGGVPKVVSLNFISDAFIYQMLAQLPRR
jgi:hypothetical protein